MPPRPVPATLLPWALDALGESHSPPPLLEVVAGDASNRRYFRFTLGGKTYVMAEAPPATEKNEAFLCVRQLLADTGVRVPQLYAADLQRGFLLLEDLGDRLLLPALQGATVDGHYQRAFEVLLRMATADVAAADLGCYDRTLLGEELSRFPQWFVQALLGYDPDAGEQLMLQKFFDLLAASALEQPRVLVHRDFHSRNLMLGEGDGLAVIDFQDAVLGPVTYDLVSLLRDCYIQWPASQVSDWALVYRNQLCAQELLEEVDEARFLRWFDWMGLQRHIKVLGTFARLYLRDDKPGYLEDLPLVLSYVEEIVQKYAASEPLFAEFGAWFSSRLKPLIADQHWSGAR